MKKLYKKFSFPYRYGSMPSLEWFIAHRNYIYDVYINPDIFGVNMRPMNGPDQKDDRDTIQFLKQLKKLGIKINITFNNIFDNLSPDSFRKMKTKDIEMIDIITIPDLSWLDLKKEYNLELRNTVIMDLDKKDILADDRFLELDCIYIHGKNLRNTEKYSCFSNLGAVVNFDDCLSCCDIKKNHYSAMNKENFFNSFCPVKKFTREERLLKIDRIPPFLSEYLFYADYLKIYKLQGRGTTETFKAAVQIIENIKNENENLIPESNQIKSILGDSSYSNWIKYIRNCGGDCYNCNWCDDLLTTKKD